MPTLSSSGASSRITARRNLNGAMSMKGGSQTWRAPGRSRAFTPATSRGLTGQHEVGCRQRALDGAMTDAGRTLGAARRMRGLGDHVGNAQRAASPRDPASRACGNSSDR